MIKLIADAEIRAALSEAHGQAQEYDDFFKPIPERAVAKAQLSETKIEISASRYDMARIILKFAMDFKNGLTPAIDCADEIVELLTKTHVSKV